MIRPLPTILYTSSIKKFKRSVWTSQISTTIQLFKTWTNRYLNLVPLGSKHGKSWTNLGHKIAKLNTMFKTDKNLTPTYVQNQFLLNVVLWLTIVIKYNCYLYLWKVGSLIYSRPSLMILPVLIIFQTQKSSTSIFFFLR